MRLTVKQWQSTAAFYSLAVNWIYVRWSHLSSYALLKGPHQLIMCNVTVTRWHSSTVLSKLVPGSIKRCLLTSVGNPIVVIAICSTPVICYMQYIFIFSHVITNADCIILKIMDDFTVSRSKKNNYPYAISCWVTLSGWAVVNQLPWSYLSFLFQSHSIKKHCAYHFSWVLLWNQPYSPIVIPNGHIKQ